MSHKLFIFSIFFTPCPLICKPINQESVKEEQIVYQFDENQKRLIMITDTSLTQTRDSQSNQHDAGDLPKMQYKTYFIDDLKENITKEMVNTWTKAIGGDQVIIIFCFQTTSFDHHIDDAMVLIEKKIIPLFIDSGFTQDCMIKTVAFEQQEKHFEKDKIQITIFFSENILDSVLNSVVDLDMKL